MSGAPGCFLRDRALFYLYRKGLDRNMKLMMRFLKPHWKLCVVTILLLIVDVAGALVISTFAAEMLNLGTSGAAVEVLFATGAKMAAASLISSVCAILGGYACAALSAQVGKDIRMALYRKSLVSVQLKKPFGVQRK